MAQDFFEQLHAAVKQAESRGQRYDEKGKLLTSPKGAEGEMQVMPKTQLDPGYGVVPAKTRTPDEIARVGKDYLKAMVDKYGDTQKALIAYNWGPGNTDKWLAKGADPKVLPAETQKYVSDITGMLGGKKTRVSEAPAAENVQELAKNAGPGYKAALAMMFLADDKPETGEDDIWKEAQTPVEEPDTTPNAFAGLDLGYQSPFPVAQAPAAQQLAQFARGGVVHRADGSPETGELTQAEIDAASRPAFVTPKSGLNRQQGPISQALNSGEAYPAIARGVAETPYNLVGAPVDIATMAMRPFGYKEEKPVMGSDWIKEKMTKYGIRPGEETDPTLKGFRTMGELGASVVNPGPVAAKVGQTAEKGVAALGKETARQMLRGINGEGVLAPFSPTVALPIVRPSGGLFPTSKVTKEGGTWITEQPKSNLDVEWAPVLDKIVDQSAEFGPAKTDAMMEMFGQKLKSFYSKQAGGPNDPLRSAVLSGNVKFPEDSVLNDMFPKALLDAAQKKDITALRLLEKQYDKMLDIRSGYFRREGADYVRGQGPESLQQSILEQMKTHPEVISDDMLLRYARQDISGMNQQQMKAAADKVRAVIKENPERFSTVLEPNVSRTFGSNMGEVMYESVLNNAPRQYPYAYGQQQAMPDLAVQTAIDKGQPLYDTGHPQGRWTTPRLLDMDNTTLVSIASKMDPKDLSRMSFPEFVVKAHQENQRVQDIMGRAPEVERALKAGKPIPKDLSNFGVREFLPTANGFRWMEITQPEATTLQAKALGNSIAGYSRDGSYGSLNMGKAGMDTGAVRLFALYNSEGTPVTHVEYITDKVKSVKPEQAGKANTITQFFGNGPLTGNVTPVDYIDQVDDLVTKLDVTDIPPSIKQLMQKHGRFANGGSVERVHGDNRRYL